MQRSVYTPGAGHTPPVLAGRDVLLRDWQLMLNDVDARGRVRAHDIVLVGPRGVGKTAALSAFAGLAREQGIEVVNLQAVVGQTGLVDSLLQRAHARIGEDSGPWRRTRTAFQRLSGLDVSVAGFGIGVSRATAEAPPVRPEAGALAEVLAQLASEVRADRPHGGVLITVDELQVASPADLALVAATLHRLNVDHPSAMVLFAGTGLPVTLEWMRKAGVTHPDRLFVFQPIPLTLDPDDARYAIVEPARAAAVSWDPAAVDTLLSVCNGYPAHLQFFADAVWTAAPGPDRITMADVEQALPAAAAQLDSRTLGPRWDRISDRQMEFLAALAVLGGRTRMALLAATLGRTQRELSWLREDLIKEGDVYAPRRGHIAITVPLFAPYLLDRYEIDRLDASTPLLPLEQLRANATAATGDALPTVTPELA